MAKISIPHDAFVFVGDGRKALFLRNEGDEKFLNLKTEQVLRDQNPSTREQGSDQPGRAFASVGARLVVVAPPRTLAELRRAFHAEVKSRIVAEIDKDLTKEPIYEIERHFAK